MINNPTSEMPLPSAVPVAVSTSYFQPQAVADNNRHKSLKNKLTPPFFPPLAYDLLAPLKGRMIASLRLGDSFDAGLALFNDRRLEGGLKVPSPAEAGYDCTSNPSSVGGSK